MLPVLFAKYGTVFAAEIAGDKLPDTTGVPAARFRATLVLGGMAIALSFAVATLPAVKPELNSNEIQRSGAETQRQAQGRKTTPDIGNFPESRPVFHEIPRAAGPLEQRSATTARRANGHRGGVGIGRTS